MNYWRVAFRVIRLDRMRNEEIYEGVWVGIDDKACQWSGREGEDNKMVWSSEKNVGEENGRDKQPLSWEGRVKKHMEKEVTGVEERNVSVYNNRQIRRCFCYALPRDWEFPDGASCRR